MTDSYYKILDVSSTASAQEIKRSYRKLAMKYHPDRNPNNKKAEEQFKQIAEAYEIIGNTEKRANYDQLGHENFQQNSQYGSHTQQETHGFSDIFSDIFGSSSNNNKSREHVIEGRDLQYNLEITLEEAIHGTKRNIKINTFVICKPCHGKGGAKKTNCTTCGGSGSVRMSQGFFSIEQTCNQCNGSGLIIKNPCSYCYGKGRVKNYKTLNVTIPLGIGDNDRIRLTGEGESGENKAKSGDLYIKINIKRHPIFQRKGYDLYCEVPITFVTACLGGKLYVPTINGKVILKIPSETQTGKLFRLRGKGVKNIRKNNSIGDLMCKVILETPINLNNDQKTLLQNFSNSLGEYDKHSPKFRSWFDNVKNFFKSK